MFSHTFSITVRVPSTPSEWQLYVGKPDAMKAATQLQEALQRAFNWVVTTDEGTPDQAMSEFMYPVMNRFVGVGASDTEPREVALLFLHKAQKLRLWTKEAVL